MSPSDAAAATPTVALASLTVDEAGKDAAADPDLEENVETDRAAAAFGSDGAPATAPPRGRALGEAGEEPSSSSGDGDDSTLAAVRRAAALVRDDRLLEAARVATRAGIAPPVSATALLSSSDAITSADADAATLLDRHLPKARRVARLIESLKARVCATNSTNPGLGSNDEEPHVSSEKDVSSRSDAYGPWLVQGEHMGKRDVSVYYRTDVKTGTKLNARVESPIDGDMLVPFLSVLNESELYASWLPNWTVPRFRVRRSEKLAQTGRVSQVVRVTVDLPWPFSAREAVLDACGVDDIDASGDICVLVRALGEEEDDEEDASAEDDASDSFQPIAVPSVDEADVVRIGFEGGFLFRALPEDWDADKRAARQAARKNQPTDDDDENENENDTDASPGGAEAPAGAGVGGWFAGWGVGYGSSSPHETSFAGSARDANASTETLEETFENDAGEFDPVGSNSDGGDSDDDAFEECEEQREAPPRRILVSVQMSVDPKIDFVPAALMNFVTRTVIYTMWCMLLRVAEGVRDGARPAHAEAIAAKKESLYDWTRARARDMVKRVFAE